MIAVEQNAVYYFISTNCATVESYFNLWEKKNLSYNPDGKHDVQNFDWNIEKK